MAKASLEYHTITVRECTLYVPPNGTALAMPTGRTGTMTFGVRPARYRQIGVEWQPQASGKLGG